MNAIGIELVILWIKLISLGLNWWLLGLHWSTPELSSRTLWLKDLALELLWAAKQKRNALPLSMQKLVPADDLPRALQQKGKKRKRHDYGGACHNVIIFVSCSSKHDLIATWQFREIILFHAMKPNEWFQRNGNTRKALSSNFVAQ